MAVKSDVHVFTGMQRDLDVAKHKAEFLYDAHNIRFTAIDGDTLFCITNEKSTKQLTPKDSTSIQGSYLGHCVVDDVVVLFSKTQVEDIIYKIIIDPDNKDQYIATVLYHGNLNFNLNNPIETLGVYENENIQKVYWVDGLNQPRVIRIDSAGILKLSPTDSTQFDFVPSLALEEEVTVERYEGDGMFAPGVIQYAFAYYNKYGRESNIFYTTPLHYISFPDRGGSSEDRIANSFKITITNVEKNKFDYLRVFSIHRTSIDATPTCKRVIDIELGILDNTTATFIDNGTIGDTIDNTELLYIGGETIVPYTMTQKDNTLFFGNYEITRLPISDTVKNFFDERNSNSTHNITIESVTTPHKSNNLNSYYKYNTLYESTPGFKLNEHYRIGVQFQHTSGKWSEPVYIKDATLTVSSNNILGEDKKIIFGIKNLEIGSTIKNDLIDNGYIKYRPVVVYPTILDRLVLTQGILNPTVYNFKNRENNAPFVQSSWFFRPNPVVNVTTHLNQVLEFRHNHILGTESNKNAEIQGQVDIPASSETNSIDYNYVTSTATNDYHTDVTFGVDQSIVTMHSPEIEFDDSFEHLDYSKIYCRLIGITNLTANLGILDLSTSSPSIVDDKGFIGPKSYNHINDDSDVPLSSYFTYKDGIVIRIKEKEGDKWLYKALENAESEDDAEDGNEILVDYLIYPWQKSGSLNNDVNRPADGGARSAVLKTKEMSNLKVFGNNYYFNSAQNLYIRTPQLFASDQVSLLKIPYNDNINNLNDVNYYGNIDTALPYSSNYTMSSDGKIFLAPKSAKTNISFIDDFIQQFINNISYASGTATKQTSGIRVKYKSTKHLVFSLSGAYKGFNILPRFNNTPAPKNPPTNDTNAIPYWIPLDANTSTGNVDPIQLEIKRRILSKPNGSLYSNNSAFIQDFMNHLNDSSYYGPGTYMYNYDSNADYVNDTAYLLTKNFDNGGNNSAGIEYILYRLEYAGPNNDQLNLTVNHATNGHLFVYRAGDQNGNPQVYSPGNSGGYLQSGNTTGYIVDSSVVTNVDQNGRPQDVVQTVLDADNLGITVNKPYLFLAELYRNPNAETDFGGNTDEALKSNLWLPAGNPKPIDTTIDIEYTDGDTWYQRYDCLKTYPFTEEDENSVVEIGSFLCETRVNIDGRYDKMRGNPNNLYARPTTFNLINAAYSQSNNFFNYRILDKDYYTLNKFPNTITWTKAKTNAAIIDLWTNVTAAETFDLDGTKGKINALRTFNDNIFCFQDNAVSRLLFNSRVQINTSDGVPIEITNSKKMEGKIYISDIIGCTNKWTIAITPAGIYFIDSNSKEFYNIGQQLGTVSGTHGFSNWFKGIDVDKYRTFYDYNDKDLYILDTPSNNIDNSLVFSENLGQFTSFMNYGKADAMFNINNDYFAFSNSNMYRVRGDDESYNAFFGDTYSFDLTFISNADSSEDKIFTNLEMRADFYVDGNLNHRKNFDYIQAYNEYQDTGMRNLTFNYKTVSNLKKKFRIWRIDIPRALKDVVIDGESRQIPGLNRIRNTWATIKLGMNVPKPTNQEDISLQEYQSTYMKLHDLVVQYHL